MCENYAITIETIKRSNSQAINLSRIYNFMASISVRYFSIVVLLLSPLLFSPNSNDKEDNDTNLTFQGQQFLFHRVSFDGWEL
jgi:hypothetical protein